MTPMSNDNNNNKKQKKDDDGARPSARLPLQLTFLSGFVPFYELQELCVVCKDWKVTLEDSKEHLIDWERIASFLNKANQLHVCWNCEEPRLPDVDNGGASSPNKDNKFCNCAPPDYSDRYWEHLRRAGDPRIVVPNFHQLHSYAKARLLLRFHQQCVRNFQQAFPEDLTTLNHWYVRVDEDLADICFEMEEFNPPAHFLLFHILKIILAKADIAKRYHYYDDVVLGVEGATYEVVATSYEHELSDLFTATLLPLSGQISSYSDMMQHVGNSITLALEQRDDVADTLLGPRLADSIDFTARARKWLLPDKIQEIFPLQWMPCFGGDPQSYRPSSTDMYYGTNGRAGWE